MPEPALGSVLPIWSVLPFAGILASIAIVPLVAPYAWHRHHAKIAVGWALLFAIPFVAAYRGTALHEIAHIYLADYLPFVVVLAALFTVAGGIVVRGTPAGRPGANTALLAAGTLLASCIGTTGAAMLLIRPLLRANAGRPSRVHLVVFFVFLVANIGGCLTPLGDPPLFLGFLQGVPFFWTLRLVGPLVLVSVLLLAIFHRIDTRLYRRDLRAGWVPAEREGRLRIEGGVNVALLAMLVTAVVMSGIWKAGVVRVLGVELAIESLVRDGILVILTLASLRMTSSALRRANEFTWAPVREVAWLFAGIFMTIIPSLAMLRSGREGPLGGLVAGLEHPWQYFWATGVLSAFLDNAPTYLAFLHSLMGRFHPGATGVEGVQLVLAHEARHLAAVAAGAVFMGALTYIGNAPNFLVKAIAEKAEVRMPSFFGYLFRWAIPLLVPVFLVTGWVFFRS